MSDTPETAPQQAAPRLSILTQYIKDASFENPRAPLGLIQSQPRPDIQIGVDAEARQLSEDRYEVTLQLRIEAKASDETVFLLELTYGGVFSISNIPPESLQPLLLIECPRLIFPFVRRIVADITRDGGFPPLMLDPIDFVALYRQRLQHAQQQAEAPGQNGNAGDGTLSV